MTPHTISIPTIAKINKYLYQMGFSLNDIEYMSLDEAVLCIIEEQRKTIQKLNQQTLQSSITISLIQKLLNEHYSPPKLKD